MATLHKPRIKFAMQYAGDFILPVEFVYDAFVIAYEGFNNFSKDAQVSLSDHLRGIQEYLVALFSDLLTKQIKKYLGRPDRLKSGSEKIIQDIYTFKDLNRYPEVFNVHTLRSSSHVDEAGNRKTNVRWGSIAQKIIQIRDTNSPTELIRLLTDVGGLYNLVHNTKTPVLDKFNNGRELLAALDFCDKTKNPKALVFKASSVVKEALENIESSSVELKQEYTPVKKNYKYAPGYYGD